MRGRCKLGNDLYYTIPIFFEDRMREHSSVSAIRKLEVEGEFVYELDRHKFQDTVRVWLSDAYHFTDMDYYTRPKELRAGDYILIAKPEGGGEVGKQLTDAVQIGVGKLSELMGALTVRHMWTYVPPTEEELKARKERFANKRLVRGRFR
jgi:hypothetical protein